MSYEIVKSITIKNNKVMFISADSSLYPRIFRQFESVYHTNLLNKEGRRALINDIANDVQEGNFHLQKGSKLTSLIKDAQEVLEYNNLNNFLNAELYAKFVSDKILNPSFDQAKEIEELNSLKNDKTAIINILQTNAEAYNYISSPLKKDKELAKTYIDMCADKFFFTYPSIARNDKELAMEAVKGNGANFRQLSPEFRSDETIIKAAFSNGEHLPDLIEGPLATDKDFIKELINIQPKLHLERAAIPVKYNRDIALYYIEHSLFSTSYFGSLPSELRNDKDLVQAALTKAPNQDCINRIKAHTDVKDLLPLSEMLDLIDFSYSVDPLKLSINNQLDGNFFDKNIGYYENSEFCDRVESIRGYEDIKTNPITKDEYLRICSPMVALYDEQHANLGGIEADRFDTESSKDCITSVIDRLEIYICDTFLEDLSDQFSDEIDEYENSTGKTVSDLEDLVEFMQDTGIDKNPEYAYDFKMCKAIVDVDFYIDLDFKRADIIVPLDLMEEKDIVQFSPDAELYDDGHCDYSIDLECNKSLEKYIRNICGPDNTTGTLDQAYLSYNNYYKTMNITSYRFHSPSGEISYPHNAVDIPIFGQLKDQLMKQLDPVIEKEFPDEKDCALKLSDIIRNAEKNRGPINHKNSVQLGRDDR